MAAAYDASKVVHLEPAQHTGAVDSTRQRLEDLGPIMAWGHVRPEIIGVIDCLRAGQQAEVRAQLVAVTQPLFLLPTRVAGRPMQELVERHRIGDRLDGRRIGELPVEPGRRRSIGDTPGTESIDVFIRVERHPQEPAPRDAACGARVRRWAQVAGRDRVRMETEGREGDLQLAVSLCEHPQPKQAIKRPTLHEPP